MPFTVFTLAMLLICIFCICKETFNGFLRGFLRALVSLCVVVFSIICSVFLSRILSGVLAKTVMHNIVTELIQNNIPMVAGLQTVSNTASFLTQALLGVCVFAFAFPILKWCTNILINVLIKQNAKSSNEAEILEAHQSKLLGTLIGLLCGMITAVSVTAPIIGTFKVLSNAIDSVNNITKNVPEEQNLLIPELDPVNQYAGDAVGGVCYMLGGEQIYRSIAVGEFEGNTLSLVDEVKSINGISVFAADIIGAFSIDNESLNFAESADGVYENFMDSAILQSIAIEGITEFSLSWLNGEAFLGAEIPDFNDDFKPMVNELLAVAANTNEYNLSPTVKTLLNIVGVLIECDITIETKTAELDYYALAPRLYRALEGNSAMENVKMKLETAAIIAIGDWFSANLTSDQRNTLTNAIASDITQVFADVSDNDARLNTVNQNLLARFESLDLSLDKSLCEIFARKLITTAEANRGQISSRDVEALLDQSRGGMVN